MKNILYFATLLLLVTFTSCEEEEYKYSCNERENEWVKQNLDEIRTMSRSTWLKVDESKRRLIYRAFTADQKQLFWKEKMQKVLVDKQWTAAEYNHLKRLKEAIESHIEWFNPKGIESNEDVYDEFRIFAYQWTEYAKNELKWPTIQIVAIVASGNDLKIVKDKIVDNWTLSKGKKIQTRGEVDCDCKSTNDLWTQCSSILGRDCRTNKKCDQIRDCGFLTSETCDGICEGN